MIRMLASLVAPRTEEKIEGPSAADKLLPRTLEETNNALPRTEWIYSLKYLNNLVVGGCPLVEVIYIYMYNVNTVIYIYT